MHQGNWFPWCMCSRSTVRRQPARREKAGIRHKPRSVHYPLLLPMPGSDDVLVLTDYMQARPGVGNLARVRPDGSDAWRVAPDPLSQDAWTVARLEGDACRASTSGWDVVLDVETGRARERRFTK